MKLYYSPGVCSLSPHIVAREAGFKLDLEKVDLGAKKTEKGADFNAINAKGYVPVLELDDGSRLTEGAAIVQYLADKAGKADLLPKTGTTERYRALEALTFVSTELHQTFGPLFNDKTPEAFKAMAKERLAKRFDVMDKQLAGKDYLTGPAFTVADAYAFTVVNWSKYVGIDVARWPNLAAFQARVAARPKVAEALKAEGLA
jgi:glutathione S-transferase